MATTLNPSPAQLVTTALKAPELLFLALLVPTTTLLVWPTLLNALLVFPASTASPKVASTLLVSATLVTSALSDLTLPNLSFLPLLVVSAQSATTAKLVALLELHAPQARTMVVNSPKTSPLAVLALLVTIVKLLEQTPVVVMVSALKVTIAVDALR